MALADLTKQLAQQAILSATEKEEKKPAPPPDIVGSILLGQIHAMQKALKEDEELAVWCVNGGGKIRGMEIYFPAWELAGLGGDGGGRVVSGGGTAVQ